MMSSIKSTQEQFLSTITDAVALLDTASVERAELSVNRSEPLPSLLEQCRSLLNVTDQQSNEPIRTLHHFACTGGTVISKCIAAMPNVQLLSEVNPLSAQAFASTGSFFPTDLSRLALSSSRGADTALLLKIFQAGIAVLYDDALNKGLRLVLRDHSHSQYCFGGLERDRPCLRSALSENHRLCSVVTVRHPIDSYLSLLNNGWTHFRPWNLDEYAVRYLAFLDQHADCPVFKYEDFITSPNETMFDLCAALEILYDANYRDAFSAYQLSGDSGRSGVIIAERERRPVTDQIRYEADNSENWNKLCVRLDYPDTF